MVKLKLPKTLRIHPVVNVSCVKPYLGPLPGQPVSRPSPIQVSKERDEEYEVDYIVASHIYKRQLQYLVHWKGYEEHEHTWELLRFHRFHVPAAAERPAYSVSFSTLWLPCARVY